MESFVFSLGVGIVHREVAEVGDNKSTTYQGTNFNRKMASIFEGLFGYLSPEMPLFQALSGILLIV